MILHSKRYGDKGPHIVIIHGLFGMSDNWNTLGKRFAKYFRVHLIDLRNHGKSPHSDDFNYNVMSDDILEYLLCHQIDEVILLGHSLGGKVSMKFAFSFPIKVAKLIVADISPRKYSTDFHENLLEVLSSISLKDFKKREEIDRLLSEKYDNKGLRLFLLKNLYRNERKELAWRFNLKVLLKKVRNIQDDDFIDGICDVPSFFMRGGNSDYITASDELIINKHFSKYSITTIDGAGHWLHAEQPERFYNEVIRFCLL